MRTRITTSISGRSHSIVRTAVLIMGSLCAFHAEAQLTVSPQTNLTQLARAISGPGVQISNPVINCHAEGYGEFAYNGTLMNVTEGVLLTSGRIVEAIGPNDVENKSFQQMTPGSTLLNVVTGRNTKDACSFEFDIIPSGDSLRFNFVFGSEEYNEWVGSQYNDVFGFFISGPGITGDPGIGNDRNIARIPNTTQAVTINNVNNGSNSQYYFDNAGGPGIQYDGFTRGLSAKTAVQPCQTYHLKLIVADATDRKFDSGVFIERIRSNQVTMTSATQSGGPNMVEGCNPGWVTFTRPTVTNQSLNVQYFLQGTATNGVDYTAIGNPNPAVAKIATIPANQASVNVNVNPIADGVSEPTEFLRFILGNPFCPAQTLDTLIFNIVDTLLATVTPGTRTICRGDSIRYQITGGANYSWSPATGLSSTNSANPWAKPLSQTLYTINITEGTCSSTVTRLLRVSNPSLSAVVTRPLCMGQSNGAVNLTVTGGVAPFSFAWTGPNGFSATTEDLVNIAAGTYTVNFNDGAGCVRSQSFNVGSPAALGATLAPSILPFGENIACNGGSSGTLTLTINGGTGPYATAWNGPNGYSSTAQNISGLSAGPYSVIITDANGCTFSSSYTLTQPTAIGPSIGGVTHVSCFGNNVGSATASVSGGTPTFSYSWNSSPAQSSATANGLAPGNYTVTVTDGYGCARTVSTTINGPTQALQTSVAAQTHVSCAGGNNGSATISATGGTAPYSYSWNTSPVQTTAAASNLSAGTWICTVTDANGCTATRSITTNQPAAALTVTTNAQTNVNCFNGSTGSATVAVSGGTGPYTLSWNTTPVQSGTTANNLAAGTWTCTVSDANGCSAQRSVTITQPAAVLSSSVTAQINVSCFGNASGSATVAASGGTSPYSFSWNTSPAQSGPTATNLSAGTRICTVTDANGCTTTRSVTITQPSGALGSSISGQSAVNCFGGSNGSATVQGTGGTSPYSYSWNTSPIQTGPTASGLSAGTWICTITDNNGCSTTRNISISQPATALGSSAGALSNVGCFGASTGSATVIASGGTSPYTYSWNSSPIQSTATASGLAAGTWTCTITDNNNCSTTRSVTISQPSAALSSSISAQNNVNCFGASTGSATLNVTGGTAPYSYSWNTSPAQTSSSASNLAAGTWTCLIVDANGCSVSQAVTISQPAAALTTSVSAQSNVACFGNATGSATVSASGGTGPYAFSWNTAPAQTSATASNLTAGTWTCTVTDANGCIATRTATITQPSAVLGSSVSAQSNVACFGNNTGSATVIGTGGTAPYSYTWNTSPAQFVGTATNLSAGNWTCSIVDANGCNTVRIVSITQPSAALNSSVTAQSNVRCFGGNSGSATVAVTGGTSPYTFNWNTTPAQTTASASNLAAGSWTCSITDANGCTTIRSVTISQPAAALTSSVTAQANVNCSGGSSGSATVSASSGTAPYTYSWNTSPVQTGATATSLSAGTWTCTIIDANACTTSRTVTITQPASALASSISSQTPASCFGGTNGSATVAASGGTAPYGFSWNTVPIQASATATNLGAGTWTCTITDLNGCSTTRNVVISQPSAALNSSVTAQTNVNCFGGTTGIATVSVSGGTTPYAYSWDTAPVQTTATANNLAAGTWTCSVTDANGCSTSRSVTISQPSGALSTSISAQTNVGCFDANNGSATISVSGGTSPYSYSWNTSPVQTGPTASGLGAGTRICTITDANGCTTTRSVSISQPAAALALSTSVSPATCGGASDGAVDATITGGTSPYTVSWSGPNGFTSTNTDITALQSGVYALNVSDANGCAANISANVGQPGVFTINGTTSDHNGYQVSCSSASDGSIAQSVTGGTTPYVHSWSGPNAYTAGTKDISGIVPGTYTYVVTDNNGCSTSATYIMNAPPALISSVTAPTVIGGWNIGCAGANSGSINATVSGGVAPIAFSWSGPAAFSSTNEDISVLIAGNYALSITDGNGCTASNSITLTQPAPLNGNGNMIAAVDCFGANNGIAQVTMSGGTAPYAYSWNTTPVQTTSNASGLTAGNWTATVTDANNCSAMVTTAISGPSSALAVQITGSSPVLCHGATEGSANAVANGGTAPYSFSWNSAPAQAVANATSLPAGTFTVTATDANGCTAADAVMITQPIAPLDVFIDQITHETCSGAADGAAEATITGGSGSYTVTWNTQPATAGVSVSGLAQGLYTVTVADNNGCSNTKSHPVDILGPSSPLVLLLDVAQISCNGAEDGAVDLTLSGDQGPYTHTWSDSNGLTTGIEDLSTLEPGVFSLHAVGSYGCTIDTTVTIVEPAAIVITGSITTAACQGTASGAIDAEITGGTTPYTFSWTGSGGFSSTSEDISGLIAGVYDLSITDLNGCTQGQSFNVGQPGSLQVDATASAFNGGWGVSCGTATDGAIQLDITGGTGPFQFAWSGPNGFTSTVEDLSGLAAGTYGVTVSDVNGCSMSLTRSLNAPGILNSTLSTSVFGGNNISCDGAMDGSVDVTVSGGTAPFTYNWSGPNGFSSTLEDPTSLGAGSYIMSITDANGCTNSNSASLTSPQVLGGTISTYTANNGDGIDCNGGSNGSIQLSLSGGSQPYTISWVGPNGFSATTSSIANLVAGTYTVSVIDANGCSFSNTTTLTEPSPVSAVGALSNSNGSAIGCNGSSDGSIDLTVSGGAAGSTFNWTGPNGFGSSDEDITGLEAGGYTVVVTDLNGCENNYSFTLDEPGILSPTLVADDHNGSNVTCAGAADGNIDINLTGGTAPFNFMWSGPNGYTSMDQDINNLEIGDYDVTVTDANGCTATASIELTGSSPLSTDLQAVAFNGGNQVSCAGATDGSVDLTITGGTAPYSVTWTDGSGFTANTEDISSIPAGVYQAIISDLNGCTTTSTIQLNAPAAIDLLAVLSSINGNNVTCDGATDGSIDLSVSGGVGPYAFAWSNGAATEDITSLSAGNYSVVVTDLNGCSATASHTLTAPVTVAVTITSSNQPGGTNISCAGGSDGSLGASINGGTAPYAISWTAPNGATWDTPNIAGLTAGTYELLVTDANGCTLTSSSLVTEPAPVTIDLTSVTYNGGYSIPCSGISIGNVSTAVSGGTPGHTYSWSGPDGFTSTDRDLSGLGVGSYNLLVTDNNGCTGSALMEVTAPAPLDVLIAFSDFGGSQVSCAGNDGAISLSVSGGTPVYAYDWTGPNSFGSQSADLIDLAAGSYTLNIRDANGCGVDSTFTLSAPQPLQAGFANNVNNCANGTAGTIDLHITGGGAPYTFNWSGPNGFASTEEDLSGLSNGNYTVVVNDGLGCTSSFTTSLNGPAAIASGTYVSFYGQNNLQCQGDSTGVIELTPQGGTAPYLIAITGPSGFASNTMSNTGLIAGAYQVSITDLNGCAMDTTITLTEPTSGVSVSLTLSVYPSGTNVSCYGASDGSIDATIIGGIGPYEFNWRGPDSLEFATEDVFGLPAGNYVYELVVTDANQCNFFTTVVLTQPDTTIIGDAVLSVFAGGMNTSCNGTSDGAIDLTVSGGNGGYSYSWSGPGGFSSGNEDISGLVGGAYTIEVTDINGCTFVELFDLVAPAAIIPTLDAFTYPGGSTISCNGRSDGSITSNVTGGTAPHNYSWTGPNGFTSTAIVLSDLAAGTYCLDIADANGCAAQQCITLTAPNVLNASATASSAACGSANGTIDLSVIGGSTPYSFNWSNGASSEDLSALAPGTFTVVVTDANGCTSNASAEVIGSPTVVATGSTSGVSCFGNTVGWVDLNVTAGTMPFTFAWSNGATSEDINGLGAGSYAVTITDAAGCQFSASYLISQNNAIAIDTALSTFAGGHNVSGFGAADGSIATAVSGGTAPYTYAWSNGASTANISGIAAGTYTLTVTDAIGCTSTLQVTLTESQDVIMPTAFSPNGDGANDGFVIRGIEGYPRNLFTVLNRWGNVVYEQPNYKNQWVGDNRQGDQLPNGTYFVILNLNNGMRVLQGYVDLRR